MTITTDMKEFGFRELQIAAELLKAYCYQQPAYLGSGVHLMMNRDSGYVFLVDEDGNVGMMNGKKLEQFHTCPECNAQGFAEELPDNECCQRYLKEVGS
jgi:hypothetical protein